MNSALTRVLRKIFAAGFYKAHSGQFIFLFLTFFSYFFYIQVLKDSLLSFQEKLFYNLLVVLTLISSPVMAGLFFLLFLVFVFKSWSYVKAQLYHPSNYFLFYSANSYPKIEQFKSWFVVQLIIVSPVLFYCLFALLIGFWYGHLLIPLLFLAAVLVVSAWGAFYFVVLTNRPIKSFEGSVVAVIARRYQKPYFLLFIYKVFDDLKVMYIATKTLSLVLVGGLALLLSDFSTHQLAAIIAIVMSTANAYLIAESHRFEKLHLPILLNLPIPKANVFANWVLTCGVLLLPEVISLFFVFSYGWVFSIVGMSIIQLLLLRSVLVFNYLDTRTYLYFLFGLFIGSILAAQFSVFYYTIFVYFGIAYSLFSRYYYRQAS
ncbi:MAG: hypothetical protein U0Y10_00725 [Spirosomataceae bacterium]